MNHQSSGQEYFYFFVVVSYSYDAINENNPDYAITLFDDDFSGDWNDVFYSSRDGIYLWINPCHSTTGENDETKWIGTKNISDSPVSVTVD